MDGTLRDRVEGAERLVQKRNALRGQICPKQRRSLPHAPGKLRRVFELSPGKPELFKVDCRLFTSLLLVHSAYRQGECDIIDDPLVRQEQILLQHIADLSGLSGDLSSVEHHASAVRPAQARQDVKQRGLADAADSEQADNLLFIQMDIDIPDDRPLSI